MYTSIKPKTNVIATPAQSNACQRNIQVDVFDTREMKDKAEDLKVKHEKKRNEVKWKASNIKEIRNKVDALEAGGSTCHECTSRNEFEKRKKKIIVAKEQLIIKKDKENKEMKKNKFKTTKIWQQYESELLKGHWRE